MADIIANGILVFVALVFLFLLAASMGPTSDALSRQKNIDRIHKRMGLDKDDDA